MLRFPSHILLLIPALMILTGCGRRETAVEQGDRQQILYRGLSTEPATLDPQLATGLPERDVITALFEGLVDEDPRDLHPVPGVAASWEISPDGLTYTFHVRPDAKWSNGQPVTAADFVASWHRALSPGLAAAYAPTMYVVKNAAAFNRGKLTDFNSVGVHAPDPRTLVVTLEHPVPWFLSLLSQPVWFPVYLPAIEKSGPPYQRGNPWVRPGTFVGNGPFTLTALRRGQEIVVTKSPSYWDAAAVRLRAIHFRPVDNVDVEERDFRAGQLHITESLPVAKVDYYKREHPALLRISPFLDTYFYRLNVTVPALHDPRVRRALSLAVDRQAIVDKITRGGQQPAYSFTPPGTAGYQPPHDVRYDPAAARALLAAAGYPDGAGLPDLNLLINTSGNHRAIAEAIQDMWRRELGVRVTITNMEQRTLLDARRTLSYQILRSDWAGDYLDPSTFLDVFTGDSGNNHTGWRDARYDALIAQANRTADPDHRFALLDQAEDILLQAAPIIPVYYYTTVRLVRPTVHGWYPNLLDHHPWKYIWLQAP